tara:strand:+ start:3124 stop:3408 length:285 start_codon:yes stop_codon:yes gene_type:complete
MHPPGGATPLSAVIGAPNIHALGYQYIITSIAINTVIILLSALFFNTLFHWRRYSPFVLSKEFRKDYYQVVNEPVDHAYFVYALSQMDTFIDVT